MNLPEPVLIEAVKKLRTNFPTLEVKLGTHNHILLENPEKKTKAAITYELFVTVNLKLFSPDELQRGLKASYPQLF